MIPEKTSPTRSQINARQALDKFLTPSRKPLSEVEQELVEQAEIFSIPTNFVDLTAFSWGEGATVLLAHGWGGYGLQLGSFVKPLVELGYRVLTFDAPAHGQTAGTQTNGFEMAAAIASVAEAVAIDSAIAHSIGAASITIALSQGLICRKIVTLGAVCWLSNTVTKFAKLSRLSPEIEAELRDLMESKFGKNVWQRFSANRRVANLKIPALLFHDRGDREVGCEESMAIAQAWDGAQLIVTSGLGHQRILRDEQIVQQAVKFIDS